MQFFRNLSKQPLSMTLSGAGILVMLLATVLLSYQFNLVHSGWWFVRAAAFLGVFLLLVWRLLVHVPNKWARFGIAIITVEVLTLFTASRLVSFYLQGESYNEEFVFHANLQTFEFGVNAYPLLVTLFFGFLGLTAVLAVVAVSKVHTFELENRTPLIIPGLLLALIVDPDLTALADYSMRESSQRNMDLSSIDWEASGLNREALFNMTDDVVAGKNVVMIYLESIEKMYTDESVYPGLTPFLNSLADEALSFENIYQTNGTNFTVAGILSSQCGTPLLIPPGPGGNDILRNGFLQEGVCFGDILDAGGYQQVFMGGATTRFAGKGVFLTSHGYDEVNGLEELRPLLDDEDYLGPWGLFDDSLLGLAEDRFDAVVQEAADANQPFNFTVLTVDAHPPDGTPSASCTPYPEIDNNIFHAVHCTDQLIANFVNHLKQSPAWENTVVFLMSDHLHMRNTGMEFYPEEYERKLFVNILNAGMTGKVEKQGTHMDLAPTLLSLMGVQHQQAFLAGNSLLVDSGPEQISEENITARISAIRYINTNLLSQIETGLCEADPLYNFEQGNLLRLAGREVVLTRGGRPMSLENIGTTHILTTLVSREGMVGLTFPIDLNFLNYELYQFRDNNFFLLSSAQQIRRYYPEIANFAGLGVLFGNLQDGFQILNSGISFQEGFTVNSDCEALLDISRELEPENLGHKLGEICENTVAEGNIWNESEGTLQLSSITYRGNERYQADFQRNEQGWYSVTNFNLLPPIPVGESCDAFYRSHEMLISGIQAEDGPVSLTLTKIPGIPLTFEVGTVTPHPPAGTASN
jgi:hypothetical protein